MKITLLSVRLTSSVASCLLVSFAASIRVKYDATSRLFCASANSTTDDSVMGGLMTT